MTDDKTVCAVSHPVNEIKANMNNFVEELREDGYVFRNLGETQ